MERRCLVCLTFVDPLRIVNGSITTTTTAPKVFHTVCPLLNVALLESKTLDTLPLCNSCSMHFHNLNGLCDKVRTLQNKMDLLVGKIKDLIITSSSTTDISTCQGLDDDLLHFRTQVIEDSKIRYTGGIHNETDEHTSEDDIERGHFPVEEADSVQNDNVNDTDDLRDDFSTPSNSVDVSRKLKLTRLLKRSNRLKNNGVEASGTHGPKSKKAKVTEDQHSIRRLPRRKSKTAARSKFQVRKDDTDEEDSERDLEVFQRQKTKNSYLSDHNSDSSDDNQEDGRDKDWEMDPELPNRETQRALERKAKDQQYIPTVPDFHRDDSGKLFYMDLEVLVVLEQKARGYSLEKHGCPLCPSSFFLAELLQRHIDNVHLKDDFRKWTPSENGKLVLHNMEYTPDASDEKPFRCILCSVRFTLKSSLVRHLEKHGDERTTFNCTICSKEFVAAVKLAKHQEYCHIRVTCDICGKPLNKGSLSSHTKSHLSSEEIAAQRLKLLESVTCTVSCGICGELFTTKHHLKVHMQKHKDRKPKILDLMAFQCSQCGRRFQTEHKLQEHEEVVHEKTKIVRCRIEGCGKTFVSEAGKSDHEIRIHGIGKQDFSCYKCLKNFPTKSALRRHLASAHDEGSERIQCQHCEKKFPNLANLKKHSAVHSDERGFKCSCCDKSYKGKHNLLKHVNKYHPSV